jgi:HNH endonuclease
MFDLTTPCIEYGGGKYTKHCMRHYEGRRQYVHRIAFYEAYGYWPLVCRHKCDNPPCINPDHLLDGSQGDNIRDMYSRKRRKVFELEGEKHPSAKLNNEAVKCIRWLYAHGVTQVRIAKAYNLHHSTISLVVRKEHWRKV